MIIFKPFQMIRCPKPRTISASDKNTCFTLNSKVKIALFFLTLVLTIILSGVGNVHAQTTYCVRAGATGANNGSDWNNAYTSLPSTLVRGATYYIADGSYSAYIIDDPVSGTAYITIKKATAGEHGTNTGWNSAYGDGQAVWTGTGTYIIMIKTSYIVFDGVAGGGPKSWETGHGFKLQTDTNTSFIMLSDKFNTPRPNVSNVKISHVEFAGVATPGIGGGVGATAYQTAVTNITISHCFFNQLGGAHIDMRANPSNWIIEYSRFYKNASSPEHHGVGIRMDSANNITFRHNNMSDIVGTGWIGYYTGDGYGNNMEFYGNIFHCTTTDNCQNMNGIMFTDRPSTETNPVDNWKVYNNSFFKIPGTLIVRLEKAGGTNNVVYNNLVYLSQATTKVPSYVNVSVSSNTAALTDPFLDASNGDFSLKVNTENGISFPSPYNKDMFNRTRGGDKAGIWNHGALELGLSVKGFHIVQQN